MSIDDNLLLTWLTISLLYICYNFDKIFKKITYILISILIYIYWLYLYIDLKGLNALLIKIPIFIGFHIIIIAFKLKYKKDPDLLNTKLTLVDLNKIILYFALFVLFIYIIYQSFWYLRES